ncbi:MAG: type II toxin-antitoxin system RelE/ParE family toxin [Coriobacteriales bacterium]|jgi:mRNA interferase RelE/StbE|nr:type II toxin-antitoxin system RelE/ParE family toxin [Coriobacteriales bacterium]
MSYKITFTSKAQKQLGKMDARQKLIIKSWIDKNLEGCTNPRTVGDGKKLEGVQNGWRWRVGTYRILAVIEDAVVTIEVLKVGHRRDVYRR